MDKDFNIEDILDKLVGHTDIACESNYDRKSLENMQMLNSVMNWGIERLRENMKWYGDKNGSAGILSGCACDLVQAYVYDDLLDYLPKRYTSEIKSEVDE